MSAGEKVAGIGCALLILIVLALPFIYGFAYRASAHNETFKVTEKPPRITSNEKGYENLVYADKGVYQNVDSLWKWKWRSSDIYNQLKVGETYTCEVAGWRFGFLSMYKNIIDCEGFTK